MFEGSLAAVGALGAIALNRQLNPQVDAATAPVLIVAILLLRLFWRYSSDTPSESLRERLPNINPKFEFRSDFNK